MYGSGSQEAVAPYDARTWEEACRVLADMSKLEELYMHLGEFPASEIHEVLAPLHQIQQVKVFKLFVGLGRDPNQIYGIRDRPFHFVEQTECCMVDPSEPWLCC